MPFLINKIKRNKSQYIEILPKVRTFVSLGHKLSPRIKNYFWRYFFIFKLQKFTNEKNTLVFYYIPF